MITLYQQTNYAQKSYKPIRKYLFKDVHCRDHYNPTTIVTATFHFHIALFLV